MEGELWSKVYRTVMEIGKRTDIKWGTFSDARIAAVYLWAAMNERPTKWACNKKNWPICHRRTRLPDPATMSRRLRTPGVQNLLKSIENSLRSNYQRSFVRWIDAKGLLISGGSGDKQAGYGYAGGGKGKGYKLYAIADPKQGFVDWAIRPMQHKECVVAEDLIGSTEPEGYIIGDKAYDSSKLYDKASEKCLKLIAPRLKPGVSMGHRKNSVHRIDMIDRLNSGYIRTIFSTRVGIEHMFGLWTNIYCGLKPLPSWVRGLFRVENWVRAKMIIFYFWKQNHALN